MMSKGPVSLVESIVPMAIYAIFVRRKEICAHRRRWLAPMLLGLLMFVVVGLGWFILIFALSAHHDDVVG